MTDPAPDRTAPPGDAVEVRDDDEYDAESIDVRPAPPGPPVDPPDPPRATLYGTVVPLA
jgi:hypothetical protein